MRLAIFSFCLILISACSSNVRVADLPNQPAGSDQQYGVIEIRLADKVSEDEAKTIRVGQLELKENLVHFLKKRKLFDESSKNRIDVEITHIRIRHAANAIFFGAMAGADTLDGTVRLYDPNGASLGEFDINASYALGGWGGGRNGKRFAWLSREFAELTSRTIASSR